MVYKFKKSIEIIREEGVSEFVKRSSSFIFYNTIRILPRQVLYSYSLLRLLQENRNYTDAHWLLSNKSDRHDALIGPKWNFHGPYVSHISRAKHYHRYIFAANQINDIGNTGKVLDVASGTGYGARVFEQKLSLEFDYTACDISQEATQYGNTYYSEAEYINGDAQSLPFDSDSFDTIVSFETMEHLPDIHSYLRELHRVSKHGSKIFISVPYDQDLDRNDQAQRKTYPHVHSFDLKDIKSFIEKYFYQDSCDFYTQQRPQSPMSMSRISNTPASISKIESPERLNCNTNELLIIIKRESI
jgi:ubiquinone/menaquinone biosynthesis C-methylase UbiE